VFYFRKVFCVLFFEKSFSGGAMPETPFDNYCLESVFQYLKTVHFSKSLPNRHYDSSYGLKDPCVGSLNPPAMGVSCVSLVLRSKSDELPMPGRPA
jgi:hypothetical protein